MAPTTFDQVKTLLIIFLAAIPGIIAAWKATQTLRVAKDAKDKVQMLHLEVNSRLTQLVAASSSTARSEGHAAGIIQERQRNK